MFYCSDRILKCAEINTAQRPLQAKQEDMNLKKGAKIARKAVDVWIKQRGSSYESFSSKMCWDAVIECANAAGAINPAEQARMKKSIAGTRFDHFVPFHAPIVNQLNDLREVPPGSILGFFRIHDSDLQLIHAMIFVGNQNGSAYMAAGNKNDCVGIGGPVGWEVLDLQLLNWGGPFSFEFNGRPIQIRYRDMDGINLKSPVYGG